MKKLRTYAALAGGVAVLGCWPLVVGQIGQQLITQNLGRVSNAMVATELVSYDRGYLSSHFLSKVRIADPSLKKQLEMDGNPTEWFFSSDVQHGLFSLDGVTTLRDYPDIPFVISSHSQLSGDTRFTAKLDRFSYDFPQSAPGWKLSMQPTELSGSVTLERLLSASFTLPQVELSNQNGEYFRLSDLNSRAEGQMHHRLYVGQQNLTVGSIELGSADEDSLYLLEGLNYQMSSDLTEETKQKDGQMQPALFASKNVINIDKLVIAEQQVDDISFSMQAGDLNADNLDTILDIVQLDQSQGLSSQQRLVEAVDSLFNHGFYLHFDKLGLSYLNQPVSGKVELNFPSGEAHVSRRPMQMLDKLQGDIYAQVPKALINQMPNLQQGIDQLHAKEYITQTDSDFKFTAKLEDGNLLFSNGQKLPIIAALIPLFMR